MWNNFKLYYQQIKGEMEVASRRGRRRKKLLDDLKDRRGYSHLKDEALGRTMWRHRFGGGFGPVVRQNTEWMNEWITNSLYNLVRYWLQAPWRWHDSVETCKSVIIWEIIVHLLVILQTNSTATFIPNVGKHKPSDTASRTTRRILSITVRITM